MSKLCQLLVSFSCHNSAVGQILFTLAKFCEFMVVSLQRRNWSRLLSTIKSPLHLNPWQNPTYVVNRFYMIRHPQQMGVVPDYSSNIPLKLVLKQKRTMELKLPLKSHLIAAH